MVLSTDTTLWPEHSPPRVLHGPLRADVRCDVCVVGAGITGALIAHQLADAGRSVVVVDRRAPARGSTLASTALIEYELDVPLIDLADRIGLAAAQDVYRTTTAALGRLRDLVFAHRIECDFAQRPTLYLAHTADEIPKLEREAAARRAIGIDAAVVDAGTLASRYGIRRPAAIRSAVSYQLNPYQLTLALLDRAIARGARVYDQTAVEPVPGADQPPAVQTDRGHVVRCDHLVYATGYEAPERFPALRDLCELRTTFALVTRPLDPGTIWAERAMIWETGDPYFYARTITADRVMCGGEDEPLMDDAARDAALPDRERRLLAALAATTSVGPVEAERSWAATFAQTADGLPFIGSPAWAPGCHFALGYGGNGITFSVVAAHLLRHQIVLGRQDPAARLFAFNRPGSRPVSRDLKR